MASEGHRHAEKSKDDDAEKSSHAKKSKKSKDDD